MVFCSTDLSGILKNIYTNADKWIIKKKKNKYILYC